MSPEYEYLKKLVEDNLLTYLPKVDEHAGVLYEAMKYSLLAGGKRIRPVLMLSCCELCGGKAEAALPYAVAMEYIHTYSLIHDDLPAMDNDDYRRGNLTNHKVFGEDMAILAGDGLLSAAFHVITTELCKNENVNLNKAANEISNAALNMVAGQVADVKSENTNCTPQMLKYIHENKTSAMIKGSILAGAYIGVADNNTIEKLTIYADNLGLAFQVVDDIQDVIGSEEERGKRVGGDSENAKSTYPSVYGLEESKKEATRLLNNADEAIAEFKEKAIVLTDLITYLRKHI